MSSCAWARRRLLGSGDVLALLGLEEAPARSAARLSEQAKRVRELLADHSASIDELVERSGASRWTR